MVMLKCLLLQSPMVPEIWGISQGSFMLSLTPGLIPPKPAMAMSFSDLSYHFKSLDLRLATVRPVLFSGVR